MTVRRQRQISEQNKQNTSKKEINKKINGLFKKSPSQTLFSLVIKRFLMEGVCCFKKPTEKPSAWEISTGYFQLQ